MNTSIKSRIPIIFILLFLTNIALANDSLSTINIDNSTIINQNIEKDTTKKERNYAILPLVFYSPETRLGFGAGATYSFRFKDEPATSRASQLTGGVAYTLEKQLLSYLSFQLFKNDEQYKIYGEVGYYRYFFYYFGIGNDNDVFTEENDEPTAYEEPYYTNFPRVRINALREVAPNFYVGLQSWFDNQDIVEKDTSVFARLPKNETLGSDGGIISQVGLVFNYDSRDNPLYPTSGSLVELLTTFNNKAIGSDFNFNRYSLDASKYITFNEIHTIGINTIIDNYVGDVPFFHMAELGGTKRMRGYYQGRYRDKSSIIAQAEYRVKILRNVITKGFFKDRFGLAFFASYGNVAPAINEFDLDNSRLTYGAGLRFRLTDSGINLRIDYGMGKNTSGFYLTFGEAF